MTRPSRHTTFKDLQKHWYDKLRKSGFKDLEDARGNLYQPNLRTIAWQNRDRIREFFFKLDQFLETTNGIPPIKRQILEMWSQGRQFRKIAKELDISISQVEQTVAKYRYIVLSYEELD